MVLIPSKINIWTTNTMLYKHYPNLIIQYSVNFNDVSLPHSEDFLLVEKSMKLNSISFKWYFYFLESQRRKGLYSAWQYLQQEASLCLKEKPSAPWRRPLCGSPFWWLDPKPNSASLKFSPFCLWSAVWAVQNCIYILYFKV